MKKRLFLKLLAYIRQDWIEMSDDKAFEAENRKTRVREITSELLKQPLTARLIYLLSHINNV